MEIENTMSTKRKYDDDHQTKTIDNNDQTIIKKAKNKKNVRFDDVTVYYFARSQGFVSVPSQGTVTLGLYCFFLFIYLLFIDSFRYAS
jgi:hypothetical protein